MKQIIRQTYLNKLVKLKNSHYIKVITGVRRSGKSTLLEQYKILLTKLGIKKKQIISYDFNDIKLAKINYEELHDEIVSKSSARWINYVFLDEIQEIDKFEKCVISLFEHKKYRFDIYLTGSNSKMFSTELATLFTGRNIEVKLLPLSFKEFYEYYVANYVNGNYDTKSIFNIYMKYGGLPILLESTKEDRIKEDKLSQVLSDTIQKDVKTRHIIKNIYEFNRVTKYILSESGKEISTVKTANYIKSNEHCKISHLTVDKYLSYLQESLLLYRAEMFNVNGKRLLKTTAKYFAVDTGIKNVQDKFKTWDSGYTLESIIFIELLRRDYIVYVGKLRVGEIDFVCQDRLNGEYVYIQVTRTLKNGEDKSLWNREVGNLKSINDNFKKMVISLEDISKTLDNGIIVRNLIDWLLE